MEQNVICMKSAKNVSKHEQKPFVWINPQRVRKTNRGKAMSLMLSFSKEPVVRGSSSLTNHDHYICCSFIPRVIWLDCRTSTAELWQESSAMDFCFDWEVLRVRLPVGLWVGEARWMTDEVKHWASTCLCSFVTLCGSQIDQASILKTSSSILAAFSRRVFSLPLFFHRFHQQSDSCLTVPRCSETHRFYQRRCLINTGDFIFFALKEEQ